MMALVENTSASGVRTTFRSTRNFYIIVIDDGSSMNHDSEQWKDTAYVDDDTHFL